ncbi:MAG: vanadium-dependent haloperoxidase [Pseudomonadota bacterium]
MDRRQTAKSVRLAAAELASARPHPTHEANGDEQRFASDRYFMSFTKGLPHHPQTGLLAQEADYRRFRQAIDRGGIDPFTDGARHGAAFSVKADGTVTAASEIPQDFRQWEAPTAGLVFDLQGPDAQAVTMPPAPPLLLTSGEVNPELVFEMAEVYELAILRDQPFTEFEGAGGAEVNASVDRLKRLSYAVGANPFSGRPRKVDASTGLLTAQSVFRGFSPGADVGPHLSQLLLAGSTDLAMGGSPADGQVSYGALRLNLRVAQAKAVNFMVTMDDYVDAQNGLRPSPEPYQTGTGGRVEQRFITTPRDLATYVHYDALYEAYLNACLTLLATEVPFDPGFDALSGASTKVVDGGREVRRNASGFALFGGPHILTLVTEVATRALKAVRYQKFNNHMRLRPEALAARLELARTLPTLAKAAKDTVPPGLADTLKPFVEALGKNGSTGFADSTLGLIQAGAHLGNGTYFLPMAFPEGSPMHPAYGAGHATVAGACVTVLKAFFDTDAVLAKRKGDVRFRRRAAGDQAIAYVPPSSGNLLDSVAPGQFLTLEGELNKLAANISIGRNMAGVHYFTDYFDSVRMGEQIAIGMLEEQALGYVQDPFVMSIPTFDGDVVTIGRR